MTTIDERPAGAPETLPHWDVTDIYPSLDSREYKSARESAGAGIARLKALYDEHDVRGKDDAVVDEATVAAFEAVVSGTNDLLEEIRTVYGFVSSYVTTDARDDMASGESSQLQVDLSEVSKLRTRLDAWVASLGPGKLAAASSVAAEHEFPLERAALRASHQMPAGEEELYADLQLTGGSAWGRLYGDVTARLMATVRVPGRDPETVPLTKAVGMAFDVDRAVRKAAYEAANEAYESASVPVAAALNSIKGEAATINRRRGWADDLEPALADNNVDRATLDAMQQAVVGSFPDFRRYLKAKAKLLGLGDRLAWYDLFAPITGPDAPKRDWQTATSSVNEAFGSYSSRLRGLAERAVDEAWIDAEPREGKRGGAFCMGLKGDRSLVLLNFDGSFRAVQTLAHELGHAYHNTNLAHRTPMQRQTPMALAETASIFCETIMIQEGLAAAGPDERLELLEGDLMGACQVVVDIHSRFLFEWNVCEQRAKRALSVTELNDLMLDAQDQTYGDALDPDARHRFAWVGKPHYYGRAFYNWPYTFGLLFGIGLYARYLEAPEQFRDGYDDLLASTGMGDAVTLGKRFGIDVTDGAFWTASIDVIRGRIDEFVSLVDDRAAR